MKPFLKEYGVPLLILMPLAVTFAIGGWVLLIYSAAALLVGLAFKPRHVWIPWLGAILLLWTAGAVMLLSGNWPWQDPTHGETFSSYAIETVLFTAVLVLLPLFVGKILRGVSELWRAMRKGTV